MVISQAVMQKWYKRSQIIFEEILKNIGTLHAGELAETNCSFYEIPAIVKNPISGFAKCGQPIIGRSCEGNLGEKCQFRR